MKIVINRGMVIPFDQLPPNSIALDGYVQGPAIDAENARFSFDHHGSSIRLVTSATCVQVLDAIKMGLDLQSIEQVFINDVDGDTALAVAQLLTPGLVTNEAFARKVRLYGLIDAHGPAYPFSEGERRQLDEVDWAMRPCAEAHRGQTYATCDLFDLLSACVERISFGLPAVPNTNHVDPLRRQCLVEISGREPALPREFRDVFRGTGWGLYESETGSTRDLYLRGKKAFIVFKQAPDGSFVYTVAKKSDLVAFPVKKILDALSAVEPGWGGGSCIGGSPRNADGSRSRIEPARLAEIVEAVVTQQ